jgi:2'-5' RNA ligase
MFRSHFDRVFFGLQPSYGAIAEIAEERAQMGMARRYVADNQLHLTLWVLDLAMRLTPEFVTRLRDVASTVRGPALWISLAEILSNGRNTLLKPDDELPVLLAFQQRLNLALRGAAILPNPGFRFSPHITVAYGQRQCFHRPTWVPISWQSHEFVLVHSLVGLTRHIELGRWLLDG